MTHVPFHEEAKRKSKADMRNRVMEMGKWSEFVRVRERNKEEGMLPELRHTMKCVAAVRLLLTGSFLK